MPVAVPRLPRFARFLFVGALNTAVGYGLFAALVWCGLHYAAAAAVGTVLGVLFNFQSTGRLVFGKAEARRLLPFVAVYGIGYVVNVAALRLLVGAGLGVYLAGALLLLPMAVLTYALQRQFVFGASAGLRGGD